MLALGFDRQLPEVFVSVAQEFQELGRRRRQAPAPRGLARFALQLGSVRAADRARPQRLEVFASENRQAAPGLEQGLRVDERAGPRRVAAEGELVRDPGKRLLEGGGEGLHELKPREEMARPAGDLGVGILGRFLEVRRRRLAHHLQTARRFVALLQRPRPEFLDERASVLLRRERQERGEQEDHGAPTLNRSWHAAHASCGSSPVIVQPPSATSPRSDASNPSRDGRP
jgi:hypothetical protein